MAFTKVATVQELPPGQARQLTIKGKPVALFNVNGTFYAIEDTCPHRGAPLWEGEVEGTAVTCPWHGAQFDLASGRPLCPPAATGVAAFKVQVVGDEVRIDVP